MFEAINWPGEMAPSRCPIHFTNELEVAASPETIWSLLVDPKAWPSYYPGVKHVQLLEGHESLRLGTRFKTNLAGQDVVASVPEFEPMTRVAWYGGPKDSEAYHAWIITPTPKGCHLRTEETMKGPLWIELAKKLPTPFGSHTRNFLRTSPKSRCNENENALAPKKQPFGERPSRRLHSVLLKLSVKTDPGENQ